MHILHVYKDYHPIFGGIENHIQMVAERQAANGHRAEVLVTNPADLETEETINGVSVTRSRRISTIASTPLSMDLPRRLWLARPDITHLHFPYPVGEVSQLIAGFNRPYVITYHCDIVKQKNILRLYKPILTRVLSRADRVIISNPSLVKTSPFVRSITHKKEIIPYGIDPEPYTDALPLLPPSDRTRILFLGRHRHYKGVHVLIEAMQQVPDAELLIGGDGPLRADWEMLAQVAGLQDRVRFLGDIPQADLGPLYASADLFCLPSTSNAEAFGIVLIEAMASGLPCITTEVGTGTSFVVQDQVTGRVVPPSDPAALAAALNELVQDDELRAEYGRAGRVRFNEMFNPDTMIKRIHHVYEQVLQNKS